MLFILSHIEKKGKSSVLYILMELLDHLSYVKFSEKSSLDMMSREKA
jgi:hypothetical protein